MLTSGQVAAILSVVEKRRESYAIRLSPPDPARQMPDPGPEEKRAIAAETDRSQSTVSRGTSRNSGQRGHRHGQADGLAVARRLAVSAVPRRMTLAHWKAVEECPALQWSPSQTSGLLAAEGRARVSATWIYRRIWADRAAGGDRIDGRPGVEIHVSPLVDHKTAAEVGAAIIDCLGPVSGLALTITADNGREFAGHAEVSRALGADFYFTRPTIRGSGV